MKGPNCHSQLLKTKGYLAPQELNLLNKEIVNLSQIWWGLSMVEHVDGKDQCGQDIDN